MLKYAAFFIVDKNDKTFIIRYAQTKNKGLYSGSGGHIDKTDKNSKEAAIRELKEETGIDYYKLTILNEKSYIYKKNTKIIVLKVESIPRIKLSEEHDDYKKIKIKNINNYPLTFSYKDTLTKNLKEIEKLKKDIINI